MALPITGQAQGVILSTSQKAGQPGAFSAGWHNELVNSELLPRYGYLALTGSVFSATWNAAQPTVCSATGTGPFSLFNPSGSGKNLLLMKVNIVVANANTSQINSALFGIQYVANQTPTSTTAGNAPANALIGSGTQSVSKTYTAGTIVGAPTVPQKYLLGANVSQNISLLSSQITYSAPIVDIEGAIAVAPGSGIDIVAPVVPGVPQCNTVVSMMWAELPI